MFSRIDAFVKSVMFPIPQESSYDVHSHPDKLVHVPLVDPQTKQLTGKFTYAYLLLPRTPVQYCMLYAHPNAVDIGMMYYELKAVCKKASVAIVLFEYTGYGLVQGEPSESSVFCDAFSAYCFVKDTLKIPPSRIVHCGRSIGSAVMANLCASLPVEETPPLLILQCPFSSIKNYVRDVIPTPEKVTSFFGYDMFRTSDIIADIRSPVVLNHGSHDETINVSHSHALKATRDASMDPRVTYMYIEEGKNHNNLDREVLVRILNERLRTDLPTLELAPSLYLLHVARPFNYDLFVGQLGQTCKSIEELFASWKASDWRVSDFIFSKEKFASFMLLGLLSYVLQCCTRWQIFSKTARDHEMHDASLSLTEYILSTGCLWTSPVSVNIEIKPSENGLKRSVVIFGCAVDAAHLTTFDCPLTMATIPDQCFCTLYEISCGVNLKAFKQVIVNAPFLVGGGSCIVDCISATAVQDLYVDCERLLATMGNAQWDQLQKLFRDFPTQQETYMSPKLLNFLNTKDITQSWKEERLTDVEDWIRPWMQEHMQLVELYKATQESFEKYGFIIDTTENPIGSEIPWDYYLLKCRWVRLHTIKAVTPSITREELNEAIRSVPVVRNAYVLYRRFKNNIIYKM
ncbi:serine peptidase [Angomonas deanei]|uniref:Alpha/beta hydrolase family n=1 Tax=Angomonas deanei TaxID=59799 RepID=A0A7G2C925_9TRYP|nr:serine peptidase [Angomonas deanei]CAD2216248.1 hypothetical protein, conserved [Angomonas deanei]|eukprot:EPY34810.1 serine peptidase [Angomonas deanei]